MSSIIAKQHSQDSKTKMVSNVLKDEIKARMNGLRKLPSNEAPTAGTMADTFDFDTMIPLSYVEGQLLQQKIVKATPNQVLREHIVKTTSNKSLHEKPSSLDHIKTEKRVREILHQAEGILQNALADDTAGDYENAAPQYIQAVELITTVIPFLEDEKEKSKRIGQVKDYLARSETLKAYLLEMSVSMIHDGPRGGFGLTDGEKQEMDKLLDDIGGNNKRWFQEALVDEQNYDIATAIAKFDGDKRDCINDTGKQERVPLGYKTTTGTKKITTRHVVKENFNDNNNSENTPPLNQNTLHKQGNKASNKTNLNSKHVQYDLANAPSPAKRSDDGHSRGTSMSLREIEDMQAKIEAMRKRFVQIALGGDVGGGTRGAKTALSYNNDITNLHAGTFGEFKRLAPLPNEAVKKWRGDMELLLDPLSYIVVRGEDGKDRQRDDIARWKPVLVQFDKRSFDLIDSFHILSQYVYYTKADNSDDAHSKWWIETPVFKTAKGLPPQVHSQMNRTFIECTKMNHACRDMNREILNSMDVPQRYEANLPKHAKMVLSKELAEMLTRGTKFSIEKYMRSRNIWNATDAKMMMSDLEKTSLIWGRKLQQAGNETGLTHENSTESNPSLKASNSLKRLLIRKNKTAEKDRVLRAYNRVLSAMDELRIAFPEMAHTELDRIKLLENGDLGLSILEAYSRVLESRAGSMMSRLERLLEADKKLKGF